MHQFAVFHECFLVFQTSNTLTWALHLLSRNPRAQDRLYNEVSTFVRADQTPSAAAVSQMPYLRAVVKETLR